MEIIAKLNYTRTAPRKVRQVADMVRGKSLKDAQTILSFTIQKSGETIAKLLKQAVSNATNNFKIPEDNLYISRITVDGGPILKRSRPRARGSAYEIQKKTSHITIVLDEINKQASKAQKAATPEAKASQAVEAAKEQKESKKPAKVKNEAEAEVLKSQQPQTPAKKIYRRHTF
jgi:large subunit ribosomal protein L22